MENDIETRTDHFNTGQREAREDKYLLRLKSNSKEFGKAAARKKATPVDEHGTIQAKTWDVTDSINNGKRSKELYKNRLELKKKNN